jgi:hypothetical protein
VIKDFTLLFVISLACSSQAFAQENSFSHPGSPYDSQGTMGGGALAHGSPPPAPGQAGLPPPPAAPPGYMQGNHQYGQYGNGAGRPVIILPMPLPMNNGAGLNNPYASQFPGSYMPRETPLHKFNGYEVCDPPSLAENAGPGTLSNPPARRLVKITSTRSLAAPGSSQPCPVYTIDGKPPGENSRAATTAPAPRNIPPPPARP